MIYLDQAATTPLKREVLEAMWPHLGPEFGNPSSHHEVGEAASRALEQARADVAQALGARSSEITFTSGGTESDNTAIKGIALAAPRGRHVMVSAVEHPAVLESAEFLGRIGYEVTVLPVDEHGMVQPATLEAALRDDSTLVSIQLANNEVGTIQQVETLSRLAAARGVPFHTDAVQGAGWLDLDVTRLGVQALSISGHKIGAPKGIGVLYVQRRVPFEPLLHGGGQEGGRRSGTENVAAAVGMAAAMRLAGGENDEATARRDAFIDRVLTEVPDAVLTGDRAHRLPGSASFVFPGTSGESILLELEARGIVCSSGSACAAGSDDPSHVLVAMGIAPEVAQTAVRFTFGRTTTQDDLDAAADELVRAVASVSGRGAPR
ncbi:cysteine desulfurase family protein [Aeromicrobium chenweiae]|uniref:Cysteine desulfurase n=1 Tax=Aeromicrobium chenweiae TaxID=2079793 RepID=A0A2S0WNR0_9ACTN|nr:cysteine desulfurase family protein [Aeromicrobium chenweiae]AWB92884.1 cysteine desulfurase [Aeromicrobium chenweiae]TGN33879.1 cysteine desulfurase [Aeromicrobium chenweiae]